MDTSKEYILMCEKAEEIQDVKPPYELGDYWVGFATVEDQKMGLRPMDHQDLYFANTFWANKRVANTVWLPRQDQLQDMVGDFDDQMILMKSCFRFDYMEDELFSEHLAVKSMEQLWLAFVMVEKYGKKWKGSEWIKDVRL